MASQRRQVLIQHLLLKGNGGRGDNEPFALCLGYRQPRNEISQRLARAGTGFQHANVAIANALSLAVALDIT